jgi:hypothetical protein
VTRQIPPDGVSHEVQVVEAESIYDPFDSSDAVCQAALGAIERSLLKPAGEVHARQIHQNNVVLLDQVGKESKIATGGGSVPMQQQQNVIVFFCNDTLGADLDGMNGLRVADVHVLDLASLPRDASGSDDGQFGLESGLFGSFGKVDGGGLVFNSNHLFYSRIAINGIAY